MLPHPETRWKMFASLANSGETAVMENQDDKEFAHVVREIANLRKADRSVSILVTTLFQPTVNRLSLVGFRDYVLSRYPGMRDEHADVKYDLVDISEKDLKSFDRAFYYQDFLRFVFSYSDEWKTPTKFMAQLLNDQL